MEERSKNSIGRAIITAIGFSAQVAWIIFEIYKISDYYPLADGLARAVAIIVVLRIYGKHTNAAIKIPWMVLLLIFPIGGMVLYFLFSSNFSMYFIKKKYRNLDGKLGHKFSDDQALLDNLKENNKDVYGQVYYTSETGGYPGFTGCEVEYYSEASEGIAAQKEELRKAEKFIFMEYHAIEDSQSFREIEEILKEKAAAGVDVRVFYDDMGSMGFISKSFRNRLNSEGIRCSVFNPLLPILNVFMNNRDHRKITVIDGKVGFTGGYNLADRYFNINSPYGHWKDTGIKVVGKAVDSLTVIFLEMWYAVNGDDMKKEKVDDFINLSDEVFDNKGIVQPYAENPLVEEKLAENVYLNIARNAKDYLYIMTPYLLIDDNMNDELVAAAKRDVDVRIITPGIPDKKFVYGMTRSYYGALVRGGVRIYEYTPGFVHAKQFVSDDKVAVVGTINLDYRSLYLHFENGVFMYNVSAIKDIEKDFEETFAVSEEVTEKYYTKNRGTTMRIWQCLLRFFAPLM